MSLLLPLLKLTRVLSKIGSHRPAWLDYGISCSSGQPRDPQEKQPALSGVLRGQAVAFSRLGVFKAFSMYDWFIGMLLHCNISQGAHIFILC